MRKKNLPMLSNNLHHGVVEHEFLGDQNRFAAVSIVGAGNWLISHDSVGLRVLELARERYGETVELCEVGSAGLALLDHLHGQELMIIVDACTLGGSPGTIKIVTPDYDDTPSHNVSVHQINPFETLAVAKHLYPDQVPERILFVLVETENINDRQLETACHEVIEILDREIVAWQGNLDVDNQ